MEKRIKLLVQHGVNYKIENGRLLADEMFSHVESFVDITDWTSEQVFNFLGY